MVSQLNIRTPAREIGYEVAQYIAGSFSADPGGAAVNVKIGTIPAGAIITHIITRVQTAFTGGTPALAYGTASGGSQVQTGVTVTAGSTQIFPLAALTQPTTVDTDVWATLSGGATAGQAFTYVGFIKPVA